VRAEDSQVTREYNEKDGKVTQGSGAGSQQQSTPTNKGGTAYIDELPAPQDPPRSQMSPEMKKKLRDEYVGLGGAPNKPLAQNWFLWIILGISGLAVLSWLTGAI
jgi:hypothetical protein